MITVVPYAKTFEEPLRELDENMFLEVTEHADVLPGSVIVALTDGVFSGAGYLYQSASYKAIDRTLLYYHLHPVFKAIPGSRTEIEVSEALLDCFIDEYEAIREKYPKKRIILRLFAKSSQTALLSLYYAHGFHAGRAMIHMSCPTAEAAHYRIPWGYGFFRLPLDKPGVLDEYLRVNGAAFVVPDSAEELLFNARYRDARVYGLVDMKKMDDSSSVLPGKLAAAVSVWPMGNGRIATENIVCDPAYQRRGLMTALLSKVISEVRKEGFTEASLSLFADNAPAMGLYQKLGYGIEEVIMTLEYEHGYRSIPY